MVELETAALAWRNDYEGAGLDRHPSLWVAHWGAEAPLAAIWMTRPADEAQALFYLAFPYAICDTVQTTFVFLDRPHRVWVSRLAWTGRGTIETHWDLPYAVDDHGHVEFGVSVRRPHPDAQINRVMETFALRRPQVRYYSWEEAYAYAIERGKALERR